MKPNECTIIINSTEMQVKAEPVDTLDSEEDATDKYNQRTQSENTEDGITKYYHDDDSHINEESPEIKTEPRIGVLCDICLQVLPTAQKLVAHRRLHTLDLIYTCLICFKTYTEKTQLCIHMKYIHACVISSNDVNTIDVEEELSTIKNELDTGVQCDICRQLLPTTQKLVAHRRIHTLDLTYICLICYEIYTEKAHLVTHMNCIHACATSSDDANAMDVEDESFECNICGKIFKWEVDLTLHLRRHTTKKVPECHLCHTVFTRNDNLIRHMRNTHTRRKPYEPDVKHNRQNINQDLELLESHECHLCYKELGGQRKSAKDQSRIRLECHLCNKIFTRKDNLTRHMLKTHKKNKQIYLS